MIQASIRTKTQDIAGKTWTLTEVKDMIANDDRWLFKAILMIYARQAEFEKQIKRTRLDNSIGFNAPDAPLLSYCAKHIPVDKKLYPYFLGEARKRMPKYAGQILALIQAKRLSQAA